MPITSSIGSFAIIGANLPGIQVFWKGGLLKHIRSLSATYTKSGHQRVLLRVIAPNKVVPTLSLADQLALTAIYDEMSADGIDVKKL